MTYDSRKLLYGQEYVEKIELLLNACRYTQGEYIGDKRGISTTFPYSDTYTGTLSLTSFEAGWSTLWAAVPGEKYIYSGSGEIVRVTITSGVDASIGITEREMFGTQAENLSGAFRLMHDGEADSSCRGYSQTCNNIDSYDADTFKSLVFSTSQHVGGEILFPGLVHKSISHDSGEVDIGESIGSRAKLKFDIADFTDNDINTVPYEDKRSSRGTFFGKLMARNPYFNGRHVIYSAGLRDSNAYDEPDWIVRRFIIDDVKLSKGMFSVSALDPIILTEDKKAKMPVLSPAVLSAAITGTPATFEYLDAPDYYFGALTDTVIVRIDSEVIICTVTDVKELTVTTRGYRSTSKDHDAGASIQDCIRFDDTHVVDAIVFALENYTRINPDFIGDYSAVVALTPASVFDDALITKPISVGDFINQCIKMGNLLFGYDEETQLIEISHTPELAIEPISITGSDNIGIQSLSVDENSKEQYTRFPCSWAPIDITKDTEENYAINYLAINSDVESDELMGEVNEKKAFKTSLLTGSAGDSLLVTSYASRVISSSEKSPKKITCKLNAKDIGVNGSANLRRGSIISLVSRDNQDKDGDAFGELYQVLKITGNAYENFMVKMRRYLTISPDDIDFTVDESAAYYDLSDFYTPTAGVYRIYIAPGVVLGSGDTSIAAFTTGAQAPGVSFVIINRGAWLGMGGAGGDCEIAAPPTSAPTDGLPGGIAFEATVDCEIDCGSGIIWAGGGGSGGGSMSPNGSPAGTYYSAADGGGGGQGYGSSISGMYSAGGFAPVSFSGRRASGNQSSPGVTNGGLWGQNGASPLGLGGIAGEAIKSNGNTVTITAGNNDFNIRGRRT